VPADAYNDDADDADDADADANGRNSCALARSTFSARSVPTNVPRKTRPSAARTRSVCRRSARIASRGSSPAKDNGDEDDEGDGEEDSDESDEDGGGGVGDGVDIVAEDIMAVKGVRGPLSCAHEYAIEFRIVKFSSSSSSSSSSSEYPERRNTQGKVRHTKHGKHARSMSLSDLD
jgi:hypothetical protein